MSGWTTIWVLIVAVIIGAVTWTSTPKGPNQVLIRSSVVLTLSCCYLMWFCVYMAQLHPLIQPKRSDVRFFD
ncbi:H(+)-transporting V0 sector ATPase subunit e [Malassezia furfur]|uniref:H(+)-transporting V0 sector ATPase subunit e n=1 Tax=Malassezia furfur TaxID=55194 RepID=A0ABY8EM57_MALFU|nr:H(+)-transporting V0 sector ATPase subunit e [Malassezia furfur]